MAKPKSWTGDQQRPGRPGSGDRSSKGANLKIREKVCFLMKGAQEKCGRCGGVWSIPLAFQNFQAFYLYFPEPDLENDHPLTVRLALRFLPCSEVLGLNWNIRFSLVSLPEVLSLTPRLPETTSLQLECIPSAWWQCRVRVAGTVGHSWGCLRKVQVPGELVINHIIALTVLIYQ